MYGRALVMCLVALFVASAGANELSSGHEAERPAPLRPPEPPCCLPPPPPPSPNAGAWELVSLVSHVSVGAPESYGGLTVYPIVRERGYGDAITPSTLPEAMGRGCLDVRETGDVNRLRMMNRCGQYVFLLGGEMVYGGKQDRFVAQDGLLPPLGGETWVPVFCSERGRWDDRPVPFEMGSGVASPELRRQLHAAPSQEEVWRDVEAETSKARAGSTTGRYGEIFDQPDSRREVAPYRDRIGKPILMRRRTIGAVFVRDSRIIGADLFAGEALFRAEFPRLLDSHAHAARWDCGRCPEAPGWMRDRVEDLLRSFTRPGYPAERPTYGAGRRYEVSASAGVANVLAFDGEVVHAALSPSTYLDPPFRE